MYQQFTNPIYCIGNQLLFLSVHTLTLYQYSILNEMGSRF